MSRLSLQAAYTAASAFSTSSATRSALQAACAAANSTLDRDRQALHLQAAYAAANVEVSVVEIVEATSSRLYGGKTWGLGSNGTKNQRKL